MSQDQKKSTTYLFWGCGNLVQSILTGWQGYSLTGESCDVFQRSFFYSPSGVTSQKVVNRFGGTAVELNDSIPFLRNPLVVILGFKPQQYRKGCQSLLEYLQTHQVTQYDIVSLLAARPVEQLQKTFPNSRVMRVMTNTSCAIQKGLSSWVGEENISFLDDLAKVSQIIALKSDDELDFLTGLNGSGPGFIFRLVQLWQQTVSRRLGMDAKICEGLIWQVLQAATHRALMHNEQGGELDELLAQVTSAKGVTLAGLEKFPDKNLWDDIMDGCYQRSKELQQQLSQE